MQIIINGKRETFKKISLKDFLISKKLNLDTVVIEYNSVVLKKDEVEKIILSDNDKLEILQFVGGG